MPPESHFCLPKVFPSDNGVPCPRLVARADPCLGAHSSGNEKPGNGLIYVPLPRDASSSWLLERLECCPVCLPGNDISTLISAITDSKGLKNTVKESQPNCSKALKINICISIMGNGLGKKRRICKSI